MEPKLHGCDTIPELDPYHRDTCGETKTIVWIDLETGRYGVSQEYDTNSTSEARWNGRELSAKITRPASDEAGAYMHDPDTIALIQRVLDGSCIEWDGSNMVGHQDDDATAAWEKLLEGFEHMGPSEYSLQRTDDWLSQLVSLAGQTDEEIHALATDLESQAEADHVVLAGPSIRAYLIAQRERDNAKE